MTGGINMYIWRVHGACNTKLVWKAVIKVSDNVSEEKLGLREASGWARLGGQAGRGAGRGKVGRDRRDPPLGVSGEAVTQYGDPVDWPTAVEVDLQLVRGSAVVHLGNGNVVMNPKRHTDVRRSVLQVRGLW